ncbi:MAG: MBL fold metallo-hydrolase [Sedimenticola sp.]|nr:MBL fold metallo-hydrolase [Sedimenticola sp.]
MRRLLSICLLLLPTLLVAEKAPPLPDYPVKQIGPHSYLIEGPLGLPSPENQGFMNNPGFVITPEGVVVIDPGGSVQIGEMVLRQVAITTDQPVVAVFNTHIHGDHWLGNQAIREAYPTAAIYGHSKMLAQVKKGDGETWRKSMLSMTNQATAGTVVLGPDHPLEHADIITIGGINFHLLYMAEAHSDTDLMIDIPTEDLLFLGDNVMSKRFGQMTHGTFKGNVAAIDLALRSNAKNFVPGHGPMGDRLMVEAYRNYLSTLRSQVVKLMDEGLSDFEMKPQVIKALADYKNWVGFDGEIGRHINRAYLEVEKELF